MDWSDEKECKEDGLAGEEDDSVNSDFTCAGTDFKYAYLAICIHFHSVLYY